jgi:N-acylglucosamine 2-epimerase
MADLDWSAMAVQYRDGLLEDVVPFWLEHSLDRECGGYLHHLDRDGSIWCTDKMMWMQGREVWMFSRLYNQVEARDIWLEAAKVGADFLRRCGRDENGDWYFLVDRGGRPKKVAYNIFSDLFAVMGLSEYAAASDESWALDIALETLDRIVARSDNPKGRYNKVIPRPDVPSDHAFPMIILNVCRQLTAIGPSEKLDTLARTATERILRLHRDPQRRLVFENVWEDGLRPDTPEGRLLNPGHAIESMAFVMEAAEAYGDAAASDIAAEALLWMLARGWDDEFGGIYYFLDSGGRPPEPLEWSMKLWWPHTEALNALLLAYRQTGRAEFTNWFRRVHEYTWDTFPDPEHGGWFGYFDRRGNRTHDLKGSKWKGFFHVPRALLNCWRLAVDIGAGEAGTALTP